MYEILGLWIIGLSACSLVATRPVQDMSLTAAAVRAAKEVQADVLSPEFFRRSLEWFFKAKKEYTVKNFYWAKQYAEKARIFAEHAEFRSIQKGAKRSIQPAAVNPLSQDPLESVGSGDTASPAQAGPDNVEVPPPAGPAQAPPP